MRSLRSQGNNVVKVITNIVANYKAIGEMVLRKRDYCALLVVMTNCSTFDHFQE